MNDLTKFLPSYDQRTPAIGEKAFKTWLRLAFKEGEELWLKQGSENFYHGTVPHSGTLRLWSTGGTGLNRQDKSEIADGYALLSYLCRTNNGGAFTLPGKPVGFPLKEYCVESDDLAAEMDDGTGEEQWLRIKQFANLTCLEPTFIISSGGKSFHAHWMLDEKVPIEQRTFYCRLLAIALQSDPAASRQAQAMRVPGFYRLEKEKEQALEFFNDEQYEAEIFETRLKFFFETHGYKWHTREDFSEDRWRSVQRVLVAKIPYDQKSSQIREALAAEEVIRLPEPTLGEATEYKASGASYPLEKFLSRDHQEIYERGVGEGWRDNSGFALAANLLGTQEACLRLGIPVDGDPRDMFESFAARCMPPLSANDVERIWRSASNRRCVAAVPDEGLLKRARYLDPQPYVQIRGEEGKAPKTPSDNVFWLDDYRNRVKRHQDKLKSIEEFSPVQQDRGFINILVPEFLKKREEEEGGVREQDGLSFADLEPGIYGLKCAMGNGKSVLGRKVVSTFNSGNMISYINSLLEQFSNQEEIRGKVGFLGDIRAIEDPDEQRGAWLKAKAGWQAGCVHSIEHFVSKEVLILEEVESIHRELISGGTCKRKRAYMLALFKKLVREARYIFICDADLSGVTMRWLKKIASEKPIRILENTVKRFQWTNYFYQGQLYQALGNDEVKMRPNSKEGFERDLFDEVATGRPLIICSDSQRFCEAAERKILDLNPEARGVRIDATTKFSDVKAVREQVHDFLKSPNEWILDNRPTYVVYSPSIKGSLDITVSEYFSSIWGFFCLLEATEIKQMLGRLRSNAPRFIMCNTHVGSDDTAGSRSPLAHVVAQHVAEHHFHTVKQLLLETYPELADSTDLQILQKLEGLRNSESLEYANEDFQAFVERQAQRNFSRQALRQNLIEELKASGHECVMLDPQWKVGDVPTGEHSKQIIEERARAIFAARIIDFQEALKIASNHEALMRDRHACTRAFLVNRLPEFDLTEEFIQDYYLKDSAFLHRQEMRYLLHNPDQCKLFDAHKWAAGLKNEDAHWDFGGNILKVNMLRELGVREIAAKDEPWSKNSPWLVEWHRKALLLKDQIKRALNLTVNFNSDVCHLLQRVLKIAGYPLKINQRREVDESGQRFRERYYSVDHKKLGSDLYKNVDQAIARHMQRKEADIEEQMCCFNIYKTKTCDTTTTSGTTTTGQVVVGDDVVDKDDWRVPYQIGEEVLMPYPEAPYKRVLGTVQYASRNECRVAFQDPATKEIRTYVFMNMEIKRKRSTA